MTTQNILKKILDNERYAFWTTTSDVDLEEYKIQLINDYLTILNLYKPLYKETTLDTFTTTDNLSFVAPEEIVGIIKMTKDEKKIKNIPIEEITKYENNNGIFYVEWDNTIIFTKEIEDASEYTVKYEYERELPEAIGDAVNITEEEIAGIYLYAQIAIADTWMFNKMQTEITGGSGIFANYGIFVDDPTYDSYITEEKATINDCVNIGMSMRAKFYNYIERLSHAR